MRVQCTRPPFPQEKRPGIEAMALFALFLLQGAAHSQSFYFNASFLEWPAPGRGAGLRVDSTGRTFIAAENYLYRLNAQLMQEER